RTPQARREIGERIEGRNDFRLVALRAAGAAAGGDQAHQGEDGDRLPDPAHRPTLVENENDCQSQRSTARASRPSSRTPTTPATAATASAAEGSTHARPDLLPSTVPTTVT